jgi:hypothetical protein
MKKKKKERKKKEKRKKKKRSRKSSMQENHCLLRSMIPCFIRVQLPRSCIMG